MSKYQTERSPAQNLLFGVLAVFGLLLAFGLSFWVVNRGFGQGWHNRAQSQLRSPAEEALANQGWDPNRLLGGFSRQMPAPNSWGDNFGKPLAYTKGIDADTYLYPDGKAPAPGSLILGEGDEAVDGAADDSNPAETENPALEADVARPAPAQAAPQAGRQRDPLENSPVGGLLNR
jgi:hypothetical protein